MSNFYGATSLIGGGSGALDDIDGGDLANDDGALVITSTGVAYTYTLDVDSALAESSPGVIEPDANAGDKRWILKGVRSTTLQLPSGAQINEFSTDGTFAGDSDVVVPTEKAVGTRIAALIAAIVLSPRGYKDGLILSNATDTSHDISMSAGMARNGLNTANMISASAIVKQIDANWAEGTDSGGFPSGLSLAVDTEYHFFIISKTNGDVDAGFDTSLTAANLLSDASAYTYYRRVGSVFTDGSSNIIQFIQDGDKVLWKDPPLDINVTNQGTSAILRTLSVPTGIKVDAIINVMVTHGTNIADVYLSAPEVDDEAPSTTAAPLATLEFPFIGDTIIKTIVRTNTSGQIRGRSSQSSTTLRISTLGYIDRRGKDV